MSGQTGPSRHVDRGQTFWNRGQSLFLRPKTSHGSVDGTPYWKVGFLLGPCLPLPCDVFVRVSSTEPPPPKADRFGTKSSTSSTEWWVRVERSNECIVEVLDQAMRRAAGFQFLAEIEVGPVLRKNTNITQASASWSHSCFSKQLRGWTAASKTSNP